MLLQRIFWMIPSIGLILLTACQKEIQIDPVAGNTTDTTLFTIKKGNHFCDQSRVKAVTTSQMDFTVRFNASAIYTTLDPANQADINKLWGFSEGNDHQFNSARIGWAYHNGALRLYAYVYDKGVRSHQEITPVSLNTNIPCSIKLSGDTYLISENGMTVTMPRGLNTPQANGYQLFPYFGGDETAPQDISLHIQ
ncbi:MAG: hypothetical protein FJX92_06060 [Bacteroidetes bacterium]|nr:hypothetical protein [Bacteroidota bacterium]